MKLSLNRWVYSGFPCWVAHSDASGRSFRQHPVSHSGVSGHLRIVAA